MNARQLAQQLLLLAMEHPDEEIEVIIYPDNYDAETSYSPELYMIELVEQRYWRHGNPKPKIYHEIHIKP